MIYLIMPLAKPSYACQPEQPLAATNYKCALDETNFGSILIEFLRLSESAVYRGSNYKYASG